jgi:hypothetical protein
MQGRAPISEPGSQPFVEIANAKSFRFCTARIKIRNFIYSNVLRRFSVNKFCVTY